ncbi:MAG: ParB/RepB/Spo0J family partition protein [Candidatus Electrothrix sp. YB6]
MKKPPVRYCQVKIADIDLADTSYALNPFIGEEINDELLQSILQFGILHPPLLLERKNDTVVVLSGRKRIQAVRAACKKEQEGCLIPAFIIEHARNDDLLFFMTLLRHRQIGGNLSVVEQAVFLRKAMNTLAAEEVLELLPMLGLKTKKHLLDQLISLLELDASVQSGLHQGTIAQRSGQKLARFSRTDQKTLADCIDAYRLGGSKQQKLIDAVFELTRRRQISAAQLLSSWQQEEGEREQQENGPQRVASLFRWLEKECHPKSTQAEEEFRDFCRQLQLHPGMQIEHSPAFEEERVTLHMEFSSKEELTAALPQLRSAFQQAMNETASE